MSYDFSYPQYSGIWTLAAALQAKKLGNWPFAFGPDPVVAGSLYSWGSDTQGELGHSTYYVNLSGPVQVGEGTTWGNIAGGGGHTLATKTDGTLWSWGKNNNGQLGNGNAGNYERRSSPVQVGALTTWREVACGSKHSLAIKNNGTLWSWGCNFTGALGDGTTTYLSSPVQVGALTTWLNIAAGGYHTLATKNDGTLWSWGNNSYGELGIGLNSTNRSSPVQVGALTNWLKISAGPEGGYFSIAIKTDGSLWAWGNGYYGTLGIGLNDTARSSPVQVGALTNWSNIACGDAFVIATKTDGTLWSWGKNEHGQLGLGDAVYRSSPVQVGALTDWSSKIKCGLQHSLAIKTNRTLWSWGSSSQGKLGLGAGYGNNRSSPVQVGALTTWINLSPGYNHGLATAV